MIPLFMQGISQLGQISGGIRAPPKSPIQFAPQMFDRKQIWTECWPVGRVYVVASHNLLANSNDMGPGIVMLEDQVVRLHTWHGSWAEDFVSIHVHYSRPSNKIFVAYTM